MGGMFFLIPSYYSFSFFLFLFLFSATPKAYGGSQARGWIRATAASLHHSHSNVGSKPSLQPTYTTAQGNAGSLTHLTRLGIEPKSSWILVGFISLCATKGTPYYSFFYFFCLFVCFLGLHPWHMEVLRLGVESELQLLAYTTATATREPSRIFNLHHSSRQRWIPDPLNKARDWTCILTDTSWNHFCCSTTWIPCVSWTLNHETVLNVQIRINRFNVK